jgi:hypothetical protein
LLLIVLLVKLCQNPRELDCLILIVLLVKLLKNAYLRVVLEKAEVAILREVADFVLHLAVPFAKVLGALKDNKKL